MRRREGALPKATLSRQLEAVAYPLTGAPADYEPLLALIGNAHFVLLGEASYGTHEFYRERAQITKRLIQEKGFTAVTVDVARPAVPHARAPSRRQQFRHR